jgi:hypothetical protein
VLANNRIFFGVAIAIAVLAIASLRVEGSSHFLADGHSEYFLTMSRCQREASSTFDQGGHRYSGYECARKLLWFTVETQDFYNGERTSTVQ